ncbi:MAG: MFS transporter [Proteobacteria bacterium]|nr:MFS transporter [Pseudomonadota bacterium]
MTPTDNPWTSRLGILVMTHVAGTLSIVSVLAMAPVITRDLGLSAAEFGFFITAYYGAQAICSLPAGGMVDRVGVGTSLVISHAIMVVGALLFSQAGTYALALASLAVMGVGYSISNPATAKGVFEWFPQERRATAMGIKQVGVPLGGILAAANGALVTAVAWGHIMIGVAVLVMVNGVLCLKLARLPTTGGRQAGQHPLANIREVMKDGNINRFVVLCGLYNFGQTNFFAFLTLFLRDVLQASQPMASLGIGIAQAASAFGRIGWGVISDTVFGGRRKGLTVGLGAAAVVGLIGMALLKPDHGIILGLGLALVLGLTIASFAPLVQTLAVESPEPRLAGSVLGYNMLATHIGGMIGPPIFGAIVDASGGYGAGWLVSAAVVGVGVLVLVFWFKERKRS